MIIVFCILSFLLDLCHRMEDVINFGIYGEFPDEDIGDAILYQMLTRQNQRINNNQIFNINDYKESDCRQLFRFEMVDLRRLAHVLRIPNEIFTSNKLRVMGIEALCIVLRRLSYPNRLADLEYHFRRSSQALSEIFDETVNLIYELHGEKLQNLNNVGWLNFEKFEYYAEAAREKGSPLENCWEFIDGTIRPICRPTENQEEYYSGHKRVHCVKYQSLLCPDGIIVNMKGPYPGRMHDAGIFRESHLCRELEQKAVFPNKSFVICEDQAYALQALLIRPYSHFEI